MNAFHDDFCANLSGQLENVFPQGMQMLRVLENVFFKMLHLRRASPPPVPEDSCWQRQMRRKFQWRGSERTLCNLKHRDLMPCYSCFSPFLLQSLPLRSCCQRCCTNAEAKTWQRVPSDHLNCFGTECSESLRQGGETASGHCNFLSLSVVRRSFGVCRCFVYIRILRHAACWHILYKTALEIDSC